MRCVEKIKGTFIFWEGILFILLLVSKTTRKVREMPWDLIFSEGKIPVYVSLQERVGKAVDSQRRRKPNEFGDMDSLSTKCQWSSLRADERVEIRGTSCPWDGKLSLKADELQGDQRHEDVKRKREYYHIIIFPEST